MQIRPIKILKTSISRIIPQKTDTDKKRLHTDIFEKQTTPVGIYDAEVEEDLKLCCEHIRTMDTYSDWDEKTLQALMDILRKDLAADHERRRLVDKYGVEAKDLTTETLLNEYGIKTRRDNDGYLSISHYQQPCISGGYTFNDLGADENKFLDRIKTIEGDADFSQSRIKSTGILKSIGGDLYKGELPVSMFDKIRIKGSIK